MLTQVNTTTNTVTLQNVNQTITVIDNNNGNNVNVTQPLVNVIEVAIPGTIGPQGPVGPSGSFPSTGSFATTGSNIFIGTQTITGSIFVSGSLISTSFTGSLQGIATTASYVLNAISSSFASTSSYLNPLNQSLIITGSVLGNVTALSISSNTASLDLSLGSFYTLQLVSGSNTFINPTNIRAGETVSLLVSTTGSATVSFPSIVLQPSGSSYVPTTTTGKDVLTFISFDNTNLYLASVKNLI
jgi:hypothetical protein